MARQRETNDKRHMMSYSAALRASTGSSNAGEESQPGLPYGRRRSSQEVQTGPVPTTSPGVRLTPSIDCVPLGRAQMSFSLRSAKYRPPRNLGV